MKSFIVKTKKSELLVEFYFTDNPIRRLTITLVSVNCRSWRCQYFNQYTLLSCEDMYCNFLKYKGGIERFKDLFFETYNKYKKSL